jgi:hypothetical protein
MKKIYAVDLVSATKLVDLTYKLVNPRQDDWLFEGHFASCELKDGRHIYIQEVVDGFLLETDDPEYNTVQ